MTIKTILREKDVAKLFEEVDIVYAAKGKKTIRIDLREEKISKEIMNSFILGRTGNFRAPSIKKGRLLIIGFNEEMYKNTIK